MTRREDQIVGGGWGRIGDLYQGHADMALRLAYLLTGSVAVAEDLV
jgi:DNA-directed RNA polymerase specialized sigma24 family protein